MRVRRTLAVVVLCAATALSGCGSTPALTAAGEVPTLRAALARVDHELAHRQYAQARRTLFGVIDAARAAQSNGTLSAAAAGRIISSAREIVALLPRPKPTSTSTPEPTQQPKPQPKQPETKSHGPQHDKHPKHDGPGAREGDQPLSTPTPTASSSATASPAPATSPSGTPTPAALASPTP